MSYIIIDSPLIDLECLHFPQYCIEKNSLQRIKNTNLYLLYTTGSGDSLLNHLRNEGETVSYKQYNAEELKRLFNHFYSSGELRNVVFEAFSGYSDDSDDVSGDEEYQFKNLLRLKKEDRTPVKVLEAIELFNYFCEERYGDLWYFDCVAQKDNHFMNYKVYKSSALDYSFYGASNEPEAHPIILSIYQDIFKILYGFKEVSYEPIVIKEKPKILHPLNHAHDLLLELFNNSGDEARCTLGLSEEEYEQIKTTLLKQMNDYKGCMIYQE